MKSFGDQPPTNLHPQETQEGKLKKSWNERAPKYWKYKKGMERAHLPASFEDFYLKHRSEFEDVLDIGCGPGRFLIPMVQDGLNVTGLDIANEMLYGENELK
ncbi:MAG: class I SAM-dependent methyltransferase [bacterium]|nr:class I SAM-dependent methyltransferase [bacterium]